MAKGWHNESRRHALASKGIKTAIDPKINVMDKLSLEENKIRQLEIKIEQKKKKEDQLSAVHVNSTKRKYELHSIFITLVV